VFAGRRSDPFFFNAAGFRTAVTSLGLISPNPDLAGCPIAIDPGQATGLRNQLAAGPDAFATANVMAIVVQIDKSLVNTDPNKTVAVWGSTHAGS
jgi:hypothetical protein